MNVAIHHVPSSEMSNATPAASTGAITLRGPRSSRVGEQAERVSCRIEHHAHTGLRLVLRNGRARFDGPCDAGVEVLHPDVQVHHHLLLAGYGRPRRGDVLL